MNKNTSIEFDKIFRFFRERSHNDPKNPFNQDWLESCHYIKYSLEVFEAIIKNRLVLLHMIGAYRRTYPPKDFDLILNYIKGRGEV